MNTNKKYDVVIVGSGLGGLFSGALLAKEGKKVCVLEKHSQIGGNLQVFKRKGCCFSAGMHYAGSLDKGQILYKIFEYLDIYKKLKITKLDNNCFDKIFIADREYSYAVGMQKFNQILTNYFPDEKKAIDIYTQKLEQIWDNTDLINLREVDYTKMPQFDNYEQNAFDYIASITKNKELRDVLAATNGLYAGIKSKTPLYIHANINSFFIKSAWRIAEDGENIANLFKEIIENAGGDVLTKKEVKQFEFDGSNISYAITNKGDKFSADSFISNIHPVLTINLIGSGKLRKAYTNRINSLENSISTFALFVVLKKKRFKHINSNIYYSKSSNVWDNYEYTSNSWPKGYMMYTTEDSNNKGYAESIVLLSMMKFSDVEQWKNTTVMKRGDEYLKFKADKAEKLLNLMSIKFPEAKEAVETIYSATPLTYRDYTGSSNGSMYGVVKDCNDVLRTLISPKTKISNLLLTGQSLNLHGMLGVILTSFQTCSAIIDINKVIRDIKSID